MFVDRGSLVVKVSDSGWYVMSSSPVPLKIRRVDTFRSRRPSRFLLEDDSRALLALECSTLVLYNGTIGSGPSFRTIV
ncbi:hypothetical protein TNCV_608751 [Trichonephila clavipes]|nr:hypothetical protein TNCV_608751 [Trichonephila clavipes]